MTSADWTEDQLNADLAPALQIVRPIGQGSLSNDFVAREAALKRLVAVKVLRREFADEQKARLRFEREAQAAARISHNHVATVFWVGQLSDEVPYIVQEYVRGRTLAEHLAATGPVPTAEVRRILSEIASGLAAAHEKRVIHRDVTPSNIMIEEQTGRALLTDFGLAATVTTGAESPVRITKTGEIIGNPMYLSPEQLAGGRATEEADIYSLGMLAYELLAYEPRSTQVGQATTTAQLWGAGTEISELRDDIDSDFEELVSRCLSEKPGHRPSAADAAQGLSPLPVSVAETGSPPYGTMDSAFRAILFVDMVGSTPLTKALGDSAALALVRKYRDVVRRALVDHGGREVDRAGDGFLISFESAYAAVVCAIEIQRELFTENVERADGLPLITRMGIGAGEPVLDGDALFGSTVNLTSRICDCAEPGQIIAARVVRELCIGKDVAFKSLGSKMLRGFDDSTDLELVEWRE